MFARFPSLIFTVFIVSFSAASQVPSFAWVKTIGGADYDNCYSITRDNLGNTYVSGYFSATVDFDPGTSTYNLTAAGTEDGFIVKLDGGGNFVWVKQLKGSIIQPEGIKLDASGNIYVTGFFTGLNADFDPGPANFFLNSNGGYDVFILKLSPAGNFTWAKSVGGLSNDLGYDILFDSNADIYITGAYSHTTDFDPGPGVFNLNCSGSTDVFILKLTSGGEFSWCKAFGGFQFDVPWHAALDAAGSLYLAGPFGATVDFDPGPGVSNYTAAGNRDAYFLKLTAEGDFCWVKCMGGIDIDQSRSILIGSAGEVYLAGEFDNTVDLDPGPAVEQYSTVAGANGFISKYDTAGNYYWSRVFAGDFNTPSTLVRDIDGNLLITGWFSGVMDIDPGPAQVNINASSTPGFIIKLTTTGNLVWGTYMPGSNYSVASETIVDPSGDIYLGGVFYGTTDFDPGNGNYSVTAASGDVFLLKLAPPSVLPVNLLDFSARKISGTGVKLEWIIISDDADRFIIERSKESVFGMIGSVEAISTASQQKHMFYDPAPLNGLNLYRLRIVHKDGKSSYSKVISIHLKQAGQVSFFPNPANDIISIRPGTNASNGFVSVLDISGKVVMSKQFITGSLFNMDIQSLPAGMYVLVFNSGSTVLTNRFIKE